MSSGYRGAWQDSRQRGAWQQAAIDWTKTFSDTLSISDSLSLGIGKVLSETLSFSDSVVLGTGKNFSETLAITDAVARALAKAFTENLSVSDVLSLGVGKVFSEILALVDNLITLLNLNLNFSETLNISDSVAFQLSKPFSDTLGITDDMTVAFSKSFAEALGLSDSVVLGVGKNFDDNLNLTDVLERALHIQKAYSDTLGMSDNLAFNFSKNLAETLSLSDAIALVSSINLEFSETLAISDALSKGVSKPFSDAITFADSLFKSLVYGAELVGNKELARILADASSETAPWMTYIAIGESDIAEDEIHDTALYDEIYRKEGTVWVVRNTFFIKATFGQDEPTGDGFTIKEIGIFDDPTAGILGRRWVLDAPMDKDNLDEIVVECAITILRGTIESHAGTYNDSIGFSDSLSMSLGLNRSYMDTLGMQDTMAKRIGLNFSENLGLADNLSMVLIVAGPPAPIYNDVVRDGDYLYTVYEDAVDGGGVLVFDISDPANPFRTGWLNLTAVQADAPMRVRKQGDWLYTSYRSGVRTIDVSSPTNPILGDIASPGGPYGGIPTVAIAGTHLYFQGLNSGVFRYDATLPGAIALSDTLLHGTIHWDVSVGGSPPECSYPAWYSDYAGHGDAFQTDDCVVADGTYVYAASDNTIWVMTHGGSFPTPAGAPGNLVACHTCQVGPAGSRAMLAHAGNGGIVYSYATTTVLTPTYGYLLSSGPDGIVSSNPVANGNVGALTAPVNGYSKFEIDGTEGYIVGTPGLVILTLATGVLLNTIVGTYRGHHVDGNYLFAAKEAAPNVVDIYDISTPASPVLVGTAT